MNTVRKFYEEGATGYVYVGRSPVSDGYEYHLYVEVWA